MTDFNSTAINSKLRAMLRLLGPAHNGTTGDDGEYIPSLSQQLFVPGSMQNMSNYSDEYLEDLLKDLNKISANMNKSLHDKANEMQYNNYTNSVFDDECDYCTGSITDVVNGYNSIHGYISIIVCIFGTVANLLNIVVLTRKDMACAPINRILKWLAVTDMFVMVEYMPFASYKYLVLPGQMDFPYSWAVYMLFHMHFAQVLHTISISLTLTLAVWRYIAIRYPQMSHVFCTERRCSIAILTSFFLPPILCIPTYLIFEIRLTKITENSQVYNLYHVYTNYKYIMLYHINFWVHSVVIKLLPCCILTVISFWLIQALYSANRRKQMLRGYNSCPTNGNNAIPQPADRKVSKSEKRTDRTTKMLVAVLMLFLITEIPQGVLGLSSGFLGPCFFKRCYDLFGELMDMMALLNGAINFILYCSMSRQFRTIFGQLFKPRNVLANWPHSNQNGGNSQTEVQSTYV